MKRTRDEESESKPEWKTFTRRPGYQRRERAERALRTPILSVSHLRFEDFLLPVTSASLQLSQILLKEGLSSVQKAFSEYEVIPVKMVNTQNPGVLCFPEADPASRFVGGGAWWAFSFGKSEQMPKNDVPNISVNALPWGLDFAINAELRTSQEVMRHRIERSPDHFDRLVAEHGALEFQAWLKLEHQPRIYHWISLPRLSPSTWRGQDIMDLYQRSEISFPDLRAHWLGWIKNKEQSLHQGRPHIWNAAIES
jgi:hypothetical protein